MSMKRQLTERVVGHSATGSPVRGWDSGVLMGAGGLQSNLDDMLKFLDANVGPPGSALERAMRTAHLPRRDAGQRERIPLRDRQLG
jgi:hypothetical protein